jgi:hypothetical protein
MTCRLSQQSPENHNLGQICKNPAVDQLVGDFQWFNSQVALSRHTRRVSQRLNLESRGSGMNSPQK